MKEDRPLMALAVKRRNLRIAEFRRIARQNRHVLGGSMVAAALLPQAGLPQVFRQFPSKAFSL